LPQTWYAFALKLGKTSRKVIIPKKVSWVRILVGVVFSSLETKRGRRTTLRPKLIVSAGDYRNRGRNPEKVSWV
jgi:hypothetical protein